MSYTYVCSSCRVNPVYSSAVSAKCPQCLQVEAIEEQTKKILEANEKAARKAESDRRLEESRRASDEMFARLRDEQNSQNKRSEPLHCTGWKDFFITLIIVVPPLYLIFYEFWWCFMLKQCS